LQHVFNQKKLAPKTLINIIPRESIFIADKLYLKKGLFLLLREGIEGFWDRQSLWTSVKERELQNNNVCSKQIMGSH